MKEEGEEEEEKERVVSKMNELKCKEQGGKHLITNQIL